MVNILLGCAVEGVEGEEVRNYGDRGVADEH